MSTAATTPSGPDPTAARPDLLVIGGTGLLGRTVVAHLSARGRRFHASHGHRAAGRSGAWHRLDLADGGADAARLIERLRPRAVVNAAAVTAGPDLSAITALAPGAMARACTAVGARFVHVSSDVVFDGERDGAYAESDAVGPVHAYGEAKAEAEQLVAAADPGAAIVRTSLLWLPDGGPQLDLVADPTVAFFTDEVRCPLRADRLGRACLELAERPELRGPLHVAGADAVDRLTFARHLAPLVGRDPDALRGRASDPADRRPRRLILDSSRARALLDEPLTGVAADAPTREHPSR